LDLCRKQVSEAATTALAPACAHRRYPNARQKRRGRGSATPDRGMELHPRSKKRIPRGPSSAHVASKHRRNDEVEDDERDIERENYKGDSEG